MKEENIKIVDILQDGRGVGRTDTKTVFVEGAVFGEVLDCEIIEEKKNFFEAKKLQTKIPSPYYHRPPCPYYNECGGCSIMDLDYQTQLNLKKNLIKSSIYKTCKLDLEDLEIIPSKSLRYRNKIRLTVDEEGNLSYKKQYSSDLVKIKDCLLAKEDISREMGKIEEKIKELYKNHKGFIKEITIRTDEKDLLINIAIKDKNKDYKEEIKEAFKDTGYSVNILDRKNENLLGKESLAYNIFDRKIKISANDFYQVNDYQIENLYGLAKEFLGENKKLLDLYCGSATSSIAINEDNIVGVDINKNAIKDAKKNAQINGIKSYKFFAKDAKFITANFIKKEKIDALVVDPPRAGLDKNLIKQIGQTGLKELVYISCNPQTLARDIKRFMNQGYKLKKIKAVDMFPQTMHVESIILMTYCGLESEK